MAGLKYFKELILPWCQKVSEAMSLPENDAVIELRQLSMVGNNTALEIEEIGNALSDMMQASSLAVDILNDLLLYEKIDGNLLTMELEEVNTKELVANVVQLFKLQALSKEIRVLVDLESVSNVLTNVDISKFSQVIRNIMSNALKFTPTGGTVHVFAEVLVKDKSTNNWVPLQRHDLNSDRQDGFVEKPNYSCLIPRTHSIPKVSSNNQLNNSTDVPIKKDTQRNIFKTYSHSEMLSINTANTTLATSSSTCSSPSKLSVMSLDQVNIFRTESVSCKSVMSVSSQADIPSEIAANSNNNTGGVSKRLYSSTDSVVSSRSSSSKQWASSSSSSSSKWLIVNNSQHDVCCRYNNDNENDPSQYKIRISVKDSGRGISKVRAFVC